MGPDEHAVADGGRAAPFGTAGDADGDVLRQAAVMADARLGGEDDRAVMADVEAIADLALRRQADAGEHFHQLLRDRPEGPAQRREALGALERGARSAVHAACPETLRQE